MVGGASRTSIDTDATVNIVDPMPPRERNTRSCQYCAANAQAPVDSATMANPTRYVRSSPIRPTSRPLSGANPRRNSANALTTADAAVIPTSKLRAKAGRAGATRP